MDLSGQSLPDWKVSSLTEEITPKVDLYFGGYLLILFFSIGCLGCVGRALPLSRELQKAFPDVKIVGIHTSFEGPKYCIE